ncbi:hypothetical protein HQ590_04275, partial [bacterium]|nr:hypothetical protein [bacterium]
ARFCGPMDRELAGRVAEYGGVAYCHMDGDLKPLWDLIGTSGLRGIDSFSPPPDNDTGVAEALRLWPEMRLHMNFPSSVHTRSAAEIRRRTCEILEEGGHSGRLLFQISENVPPWAWRTSFSAITRELETFGVP